jgi:2-amino-4-hydroxy-6-hydroxymethyldihydropteridine diphosphokinase
METCYLLIGSNKGNRLSYLQRAAEAVSMFAGAVLQFSSVYETEPWGFEDSTPFLNQVIEVHTNWEANELMKKILLAETELGRERIKDIEGYTARIIDIDLLFYGQHIINEPGLIVPHPRLHERRFTLVPLAEIAPWFVHPVLKMDITQLQSYCNDRSKVEKFITTNS